MQLLNYWHGPTPCPEWRNQLLASVIAMYPEAEVLNDFAVIDADSEEFRQVYRNSDRRRFEWCGSGPDRLWVDSDIELLKPLPLGENALMAWERYPHWSICWSGQHPEAFKPLVNYATSMVHFRRAMRAGIADTIPGEYFAHWGSDLNGNKTTRKG